MAGDLDITVSELLDLVQLRCGDGLSLDLLRTLGGHRTELDSGAPPDVPAAEGSAPRVVVVGAGIAGLVLSHELLNRGVEVELWEASSRPGGRNLTLRDGDRLRERGFSEQQLRLPEGAHFNAGPGRISHHHRAVLHYCRRFQLPLRPYLTLNRGALVHRWIPSLRRDVTVRNRQVHFDGLGRLGELASRFDPTVDGRTTLPEDLRPVLNEWLAQAMNVTRGGGGAGHYQPDGRQGFRQPRGGADQPGTPHDPLSLEQILRLGLWQDDPRRSPDVLDEQVAMMEIEGGNDGLVRALATSLKGRLHLKRRLQRIIQTPEGVVVEGHDLQTEGRPATSVRREADRVVMALQPQAMKGLDLNLPASVIAGLNALPRRFAVKVGGWMRRRFWEEDEGIYGGISFTNLPIQQIWYPNSGLGLDSGGLMVLAYAALHHGEALGRLEPQLRCRAAARLASHVHPQIPRELDVDRLITIAWQNIEGVESPWVAWTPELHRQWFSTLCRPHGRLAFAGDWCSHLPAWQEGAIRSAYSLLAWAIHGHGG
ncbi:FAD-dependent oxidoreductase [Cyanobium sp. LEGE 06143]|uniref:flavin monoamine oxidase family protein n=1 Tax=Cyanobium sp. LEGE 06143 TaxID=945727 RepID=UPI00187E6BE1|nr:FAD-dependent oxidoreductase [Cyanobium sp. LEGE 06143]MBE9171673.1 FAD-dependent oxidoreductase [Cyanobium sp. LEGE 06143]